MANVAMVLQAKKFNPFTKMEVFKVSDFEAVATVEVPAGYGLEYVFEVTNSIDYYWGENESVVPMGKAVKGCRSTSVGDLVLANDKVYLVANMGFKEVKLINDEI